MTSIASFDIDALLDVLSDCKQLKEEDVISLCEKVSSLL